MEPRRRLISGPAIVIALVFTLGGLVGGRLVEEARADDARADLAVRAAEAGIEVDHVIERAIAAISAPTLGGRPTPAERFDQAEDGLVVAGTLVGRSATSTDAFPVTARDRLAQSLGDSDVRIALEVAADSGETRIATDASARSAVVIAARYGQPTPRTVAARRAGLTGFTVGVIDLPGLTESFARSADFGERDGVALVVDGEVVQRTGERQGDDITVPIGLPGERWEFRAGGPSGAGVLPWVVALTGIVAAGAVLGLAISTGRARIALERAAAAREDELELVAEVGSLLQQSLDLADLLPALTTTLTDRLDLAGCAVVLADDLGQLSATFVVGRRPANLPAHAADIPRSPDALAAGEAAFLPIQRAGRAIGALWIAPRDGLDDTEMRAARAVTEITGSAIVNAQSFEREQETARRLIEVDQLKNDFLGTVSHELRTPVTAIRGFSAILDSQWDTVEESQRRDLIGRIARNSASLASMLAGLLDFARIERQSLHVEPTIVDLSEIASNVVDQTSSLVEQHRLEVDIEPGVQIWGDPQAIERILSNLLTNAAKFSPAETTIRVGVRRTGDRVLMSVADEGPGVPPEERARIFARFYRGSGDQARSTRGAGVGLAVVKELVDRLDARVTVTDAPGGGARFVVSFAAGVPAAGLPDADLPAADLSGG